MVVSSYPAQALGLVVATLPGLGFFVSIGNQIIQY